MIEWLLCCFMQEDPASEATPNAAQISNTAHLDALLTPLPDLIASAASGEAAHERSRPTSLQGKKERGRVILMEDAFCGYP